MTLLTASAHAAAPSAPAPRPCAEDARKFCKTVKTGQGRLNKCLSQHEAELSQACRQHRQSIQERVAKFHDACAEDMRKFCKGIKPGKGREVPCLKSHQKELSEACRAEFKQGREAVQLSND
jgi:hypothetical protein